MKTKKEIEQKLHDLYRESGGFESRIAYYAEKMNKEKIDLLIEQHDAIRGRIDILHWVIYGEE